MSRLGCAAQDAVGNGAVGKGVVCEISCKHDDSTAAAPCLQAAVNFPSSFINDRLKLS